MIKVAAYCRVSTDHDDQLHSLESQKRYFDEYINRNEDWVLTQIYVDEGITGTSTEKRTGFKNMMEDAFHHDMELIITKEISRFARNTLDSIYYSRVLKELGIGILFLNDNINTLDADAELRLTILSSIAQEESRKTSERVKWGQKRSMERGVVFGRDLLGYDVRKGKLYINEEGAEIVRLIFHKFVMEGKGTYTIAKELNEIGIPTFFNQKQWHTAVILRILRNEKYCGDLMQRKTYTPNFLEHKKKQNEGQEEFIAIENHHNAIIDKTLFLKAQEELSKRSPNKETKQKYSNRYCFSGLIKCASCGSSYVARTKKGKDGRVYRYWRCYEAVNHGKKHFDKCGKTIGCDNRTLSEDILQQILMDLISNLKLKDLGILEYLNTFYKKSNGTEKSKSQKLQQRLEQCSTKRKRLIELYLSGEITKTDFQELKQKQEIEIQSLHRDIKNISPNNETSKEVLSHENLSESKIVTKGEKTFQKEYITNILEQEDIKQNKGESLTSILSGAEWNDTFYHNIIKNILVYEDGTVEISIKYILNKVIYEIHEVHIK